MEAFFDFIPLNLWLIAVGIAFAAGLIKGVVGFALPLVMLSGLASIVEPIVAVIGLILPTLVTNFMQAMRGGLQSALDSTRPFLRFLTVGAVFLFVGALMMPYVSERLYFLALGIPITLYVLSQMAGWQPTAREPTPTYDLGMGAVAGFFGGVGAIWGPPTVAYLTALGTPKKVQVQVQGVVFFLGAVGLSVAHLISGILTAETMLFSASLVLPAIFGMMLGTRVQDRIDQTQFRRATLLVLLVATSNLIRKGLMS